MFDAVRVKNECVEWIRRWFAENGKGCNAIIGISGGKDSTVAAALCVEALGRERVIGVMMPKGVQSDLEDSYAVVNCLGISYICANIRDTYEAIMCDTFICPQDVTPDIRDTIEVSEQTRINLAPRLRMTTLYAIAQSMNGRVCNTSNLSEKQLGWFTLWADNAGDFSPLGSMTSDEVIAVGDVIAGLPGYLVHKSPADGLSGKTDEDNFGFTYEEANDVILYERCNNPEAQKKIEDRIRRSAFKRMPMPTFYFMRNP